MRGHSVKPPSKPFLAFVTLLALLALVFLFLALLQEAGAIP